MLDLEFKLLDRSLERKLGNNINEKQLGVASWAWILGEKIANG